MLDKKVGFKPLILWQNKNPVYLFLSTIFVHVILWVMILQECFYFYVPQVFFNMTVDAPLASF